MRSFDLRFLLDGIFLFMIMCILIIFILPRYSYDFVVEGEVIAFYDETRSTVFNSYVDNLVVVEDVNGDIYKIKDDKLLFTSSVGDNVKLVYSVKRNCFDVILEKKIVSVDILSEV